jgi:hypothetical protein
VRIASFLLISQWELSISRTGPLSGNFGGLCGWELKDFEMRRRGYTRHLNRNMETRYKKPDLEAVDYQEGETSLTVSD